MFSSVLINSINVWAGIVTLLMFAFAFVGYTTKSYQKIKLKVKEQEKSYAKVSEEIKNFASKGTSLQKRQDIFIYVNSSLSQGRHSELRLRYYANFYLTVSYIGLLFAGAQLCILSVFVKQIEKNIYNYSLIILLIIIILFSAYSLYRFVRVSLHMEHLSKLNDAYSNAFTSEIRTLVNL